MAGNPTYRELSRRAGYSGSALAAAANGQALPTLELTLAYAVACGGDAHYWRTRWQQADHAARIKQIDEPDGSQTRAEPARRGGADTTDAPGLESASSGTRRRAAVPVAAVALAVGAALTAIRLAAARSRPGRARADVPG